jgi:hypothetical protein
MWTVLLAITLPVVRNTPSRATLKLLCTTGTGIRCRSCGKVIWYVKFSK